MADKKFKTKNSIETTQYYESMHTIVANTASIDIDLSLSTFFKVETSVNELEVNFINPPQNNALNTYTILYTGSISDTSINPWDVLVAKSVESENLFTLAPNLPTTVSAWDIKPDGSMLFYCNDNVIVGWGLANNFQLSSIESNATDTLSLSNVGTPQDFTFGNDGESVYYLDPTTDLVTRVQLATNWVLDSTGSTTSNSAVLNLSNWHSTITGNRTESIVFNDTGTKCYILTSFGDMSYYWSIGLCELTEAWNVETLSQTSTYWELNSTAETTNGIGNKMLAWGPEGKALYVLFEELNSATDQNRVYSWELDTPYELDNTAIYDVSSADANRVAPITTNATVSLATIDKDPISNPYFFYLNRSETNIVENSYKFELAKGEISSIAYSGNTIISGEASPKPPFLAVVTTDDNGQSYVVKNVAGGFA